MGDDLISYKIPESLDASYFDIEFNFQTKDGLSLNRPVSAKTVVISLLSLLGWFYLIFNSFIKSGGLLVIVGFTIVWIVLTALLAKTDRTKRIGLEMILPIINYIPKSSRVINVRQTDDVSRFKALTNLSEVDPKDGMIYFLDGTIGYVYQIVGSASILMFSTDKQEVLKSVDSFYRKLPYQVELIFDSVKESQKTEHQLEALHRHFDALQAKSCRGLVTLYNEQYKGLKYGVGERFKSTHQYLIVKAPNQDLLDEFEMLFQGGIEESGLMFKYAKPLSYAEAVEYFKGYFGKS